MKLQHSDTIADGEERWFRTHVEDTGLDGNPRIVVVGRATYDVSVFYVCDGGGAFARRRPTGSAPLTAW